MNSSRFRRLLAAVLGGGVALTFLGIGSVPASAGSGAGVVYTLSNRANNNAVLVFERASDGSLSAAGKFGTAGDGTGAGLGSQGALVLHGDRLFAVDAGSDEITSFDVSEDGLTLTRIRTVDSNGDLPISLTVSGSSLYVLNAGGDGNISGFTGARSGKLRPIRHSTEPLSGSGVGPAEVSFADRGDVLVVTEKNTNLIDTYAVDADTGRATGPETTASEGMTPFGFANRNDCLVVSEAAGGAPGATTVSSYTLDPGDTPHAATSALASHQGSACWVAIARHTRYAYVANTGSSTISGLRMHKDGSVSLLDASGVTATTGAAPADMAVSAGSDYLYVRAGGAPEIDGFAIQGDGGLSPVGTPPAIPASAVGLASR
ncbi:MAG: lactonase family protein [Actinomycetota bacterium]